MKLKSVFGIAMVLFISLILLIFSAVVAEANDVVRYGETGPAVVELQTDLKQLGYAVTPDGQFGPVTLKAVNHFQRANRLPAVRQAGPLTLAALERATVTRTAVRGTRVQISAPAPPPTPSTAATGRCAEWVGALEYLSPGWDVSRMQNIMYRESRCNPNVTSRTGCCHGLLQIHEIHIPNLGVCGVYSPSDLFAPDKNICSAAVVYNRAGGMSPWNL